MAKEELPIYGIEDFKGSKKPVNFFYLSTFSEHLQEHKFIQRPHKHDFFIVLVVTHGTGTHTIDFREYKVAPGAAFFLTPGQVHSWQLSSDADGFILFFSQEYCRDQQKLFSYPYFATHKGNEPLKIRPTDLQQFKELFGEMMLEYEQQLQFKDEVLRDYLDILLIKMLRLYHLYGFSLGYQNAIHTEILQLQNLIDLNYKAHQPVSFYAGELHTTTKHLNEITKKALGKTPTQLIQARIILEAKRLLTHSQLSIKEVAVETGFEEISYFFRFFKKHTSLTPEQFRKEQLKTGV